MRPPGSERGSQQRATAHLEAEEAGAEGEGSGEDGEGERKTGAREEKKMRACRERERERIRQMNTVFSLSK